VAGTVKIAAVDKLRGLKQKNERLERDNIRLKRQVAWLDRQVCAHLDGLTFTYEGEEYPYFLHPYNKTWGNERAVELAIAWKVVRDAPPGTRIVEVGNVVGRYYPTDHVVVDKYERHDKVTHRVDVVDFSPDEPPDLVVSVSTLEHIRGHGEFARAVEHVTSWIGPEAQFFFTVPLGYNSEVDRFFAELDADPRPAFQPTFLRRVSGDNLWSQVPYDDVADARYGDPYPFANALAVTRVLGSHLGDPHSDEG
jgi:hypothetical protein